MNKHDWRKILKEITRKLELPPKTKPAPTSRELDRLGDANDAGILDDEAFELDRERDAMQGWNK